MKERMLADSTISSLCMGLSMMLHAGVGTGDSLALMAEGEEEGSYRELLLGLAKQVDDGSALSEAVRETGRFPDYVCGLLETGEKAGRTEEALAALARHYEERARLERRIRSALLYPSVLLVIMLAVIGVLLVKVLPVFNEVYAYMGAGLSGVAGGLLSLGQALDSAMPVLCVLLGLVVLFLIFFAASGSFREKVTAVFRRRFGDTGVSKKINTARIAQMLSMGLSSGLPAEEALSMAASMLKDVPAAKARCEACIKRLDAGDALAEAMQKAEVLPRTECRLLELGLKSGTGDEAMERIAKRLSEESGAELEETVGKAEPALVLVTSVLVGLILLSVMLPLMEIMTAVG